jgi:hypothetical protein
VATSTTVGAIGSSANTLHIARRTDGFYQTNGYMSSIRIIKGTALYTGPFALPTAPPTATLNTSLLLNFTNAGIVDKTGRNNLETTGDARYSVLQSRFTGSSMLLDGTGDYIIIPHSPTNSILSGNFTIEFWVYPTVATGSRVIIAQWQQTQNLGGFTLGTSGNVWAFSLGSFSEDVALLVTTSTFTINTWYHIAVVRSGSNFTMYVNGQSQATNTSSSTRLPIAVNYSLGNYYAPTGAIPTTNPDFAGYIDELRITKGVARYTANFTPQTITFAIR